MATPRKLFFRKPPDGLLEICERVYVFDCCFTTDAWKEENYKVYIDGIVGQLREDVPDVSILVFNFRGEENKSQMLNILSEYDMTIMDYPRHYEGCPVLKMEVIHHFLRSGESWLSLGQHNVLLMHCERGSWPVMAFMLAALLIYGKQYSGEQRTLDMVYRQAPRELLHFLTPLNPFPSQRRYLQYVSRRNVALDWPPLDRTLALDCITLRFIPNFDGEGGCCPIFRIYGQDPFLADKNPKILYSTPKRNKTIRAYKQGECELIKIDINCHIQGDVVIECINLSGDMEHEQMIFRMMFNTAFIRSNILMLNRDEIDVLWDAKEHFPKSFRAEILFSEMDTAAAAASAVGTSCFEEKGGLPMEAFAKVQEFFNHLDWLNPKADVAFKVLHQISAPSIIHDKLDSSSDRYVEHETGVKMLQRKTDEENSFSSPNLKFQSVSSTKQFLDNDRSRRGDELVDDTSQVPGRSNIICQEMSSACERISESSKLMAGSANLDIKLLTPSSVDTSSISLSPRTPPPRSALNRSAKEAHDSSPHPLFPLKPRYPVTEETETQLLDRSQSSIFSSTPGNSLSGTSSNKLPDYTASHRSASAITSTRLPAPSPPPPPLTPPLKEIHSVKAGSLSSPSQPSTPTSPPTPTFKEQKPVRPGHPPPPTPPLKEIHPVKTGSYSSPLQPSTPTTPPTPPLEEQKPIRPRHSPPSPPSPKEEPLGRVGAPPLSSSPPKEQHFRARPPPPPPPPLKEEPPISAGPPPPPPLPCVSGKAGGPTIAPPVPVPPPPPPPPPPSTALSSKHHDPSMQNSSSVSAAPAAPPPPAPVGKGGPKPGNAFLESLSLDGDGNNISGAEGPKSSSPTGSKGRILSRTLSSKSHAKKLKPLHWLKLSRAVQGSLWAETQKCDEASKVPEIDMSELESLFLAAVPSPGAVKKSIVNSSVGPKSDKVQLIEHRRAYNCEIMLSKVKVPLHDLMRSVLSLEESTMDIDQVENLIKFCPTKEEMELLKGYTGEMEKLGRCEQFFLELMKVPRVESKLRVFAFKIQFHSQVSDVRKSLNIVNAAAEEIRNSVKLKRIMHTILSLGNALNQGTARGSAIGFRLDSLLKLTETRARNKKMTLMHYLCKMLADKLPEVLDFSKDLANLEPAAKIQLKFLAEEMQAISKGLEKIVQELSTSENDGPISETFRKNLKEFLCSAEAEVRSLASLYSRVGRNVDVLILYFCEDPSRCPFEQVMSTLLNFTRMFNNAHEENCEQLELEMKKAAETEKKICESEQILPPAIQAGNVK